MSSPKQMMDFKPVKSVDANVSNEHQRNWSDELFERKAKNPDHNYDRSRTDLNFQVGPGRVIIAVDKSRRIGDSVEEIIKKHLRPGAWKNRSRLGQCAGADWDTFDAAKLMIFSETVAF